jgi:hypothetical protein
MYSFKVAYGMQTTYRWLRAELTSALHYIMKSLYYYHHHHHHRRRRRRRRHCSTLFLSLFATFSKDHHQIWQTM